MPMRVIAYKINKRSARTYFGAITLLKHHFSII